MRQITQLAVEKLFSKENLSKGNTTIEAGYGCARMYLHGNEIATLINDVLLIDTCGWFSNTTKERLNGVLDHIGKERIYQKNFNWFLMGKKWNGKEVRIKKNDWEYVRNQN